MGHCILTHKAQKNASESNAAEVVCCKYLPSITDELSREANSVDPEQTAPICVHTVCQRGFLNISADVKSRRLLLQLAQ